MLPLICRLSAWLHGPRFIVLSVAPAALVCFLLAAPRAGAQSFDATTLRQPTDLTTTWLVKAGDNPAFADPNFDDSTWARFNSATSIHGVIPDSNPQVVWYRLHVKVLPDQTGLALAEWNISSAFEVYVNGHRIMQTGQVAPFAAYTFSAHLLEPIPNRDIATGSLLIALRVHISRLEWDDQFAGFYSTNLTIGQLDALQDKVWLTVIGQSGPTWITELFGFGLGIVALALFTAQRRQWEYLWIFLQFFATGCTLPLLFYEIFHNVPANWDLMRQPLQIASMFFEILMYFAFVRMRFGWWIRIVCAVAFIGLAVSLTGQAHGTISRVASVLAQFPLLILVAGVIPVLLIIHLRRGNREAGILLVPVLLQSISIYIQVVLFFVAQIPAFIPAATRINNLLFNYPLGPFQVSIGQLSNLLYLTSLAIIMVRRSTRISHQQAWLEGELSAAREVQQVILPEQVETIPGFTVESVYQPAQQVGGDFFQVLPAEEGGMLLVMGDVAGKGLPAAMLVSVLVGAIRGVAEYTKAPAEMLANLNERLIGRGGASFSTALVTHIAADGFVTIANAGHLSPYLDGKEIELPGALPLGVQPRARYGITRFYLEAGSSLTFISDGVVEAQNAQGELFGFDQAQAISTQPAAAIVEAARKFGQFDDITVVTIRRAAAMASAA